jgi:hypothetical protein
MAILWIEYEGTIVQVQILVEFGLQPSKQRGSAMETLMMMTMEIDALPFLILVSSSSCVLVEMVMEAVAALEAAERQGSAPRACEDGSLSLGSSPLYIGLGGPQ